MTLTAPVPTEFDDGAPPRRDVGEPARPAGWLVRADHDPRRRPPLARPGRGVLITSFRPESLVDTTGWWTVFGASLPLRGVDARQLPAGARRRRVRERVPQQPRGRGTGDHHPDHDRRVRRLRLLVDGVPWSLRAVRDRRRAPRGTAADGVDPDPPALHRWCRVRRRAHHPGPRPERHLPRGVAGAHRVRPPARHLSPAQLHRRRCRRRSSSRRRSTAPTTSRSSGGWSSRCRCRRSPRSRSSSSCGCGTTCWWRTCSWAARGRTACSRSRSRTWSGRAVRTGNCSPRPPSSRWSLPLIVFFSLQRYFVRGLTAGSVKG